jgi:hypothetical protein
VLLEDTGQSRIAADVICVTQRIPNSACRLLHNATAPRGKQSRYSSFLEHRPDPAPPGLPAELLMIQSLSRYNQQLFPPIILYDAAKPLSKFSDQLTHVLEHDPSRLVLLGRINQRANMISIFIP